MGSNVVITNFRYLLYFTSVRGGRHGKVVKENLGEGLSSFPFLSPELVVPPFSSGVILVFSVLFQLGRGHEMAFDSLLTRVVLTARCEASLME